MKRLLDSMALTALAGMLLAGCTPAQHAQQLILPDPGDIGALNQQISGTGKQLIQRGQIDAHRRIAVGAEDIEIDVWILHATVGESGASKGTVVLLHRFGSSKLSYRGTSRRLARMGYDVVLMDLRAHGRSGGKYCTHGIKEKADVKAVLDALLAEEAVREPFYAAGEGLGAVTAIQYAALDPRCKGVMAIDAYTDFTSYAMWRTRYLSPEQRQKTLEYAIETAGFDPEKASALAAIQKVDCPVLLAYAEGTHRVPAEHPEKLYRAADQPKELMSINLLSLLHRWEDWLAEQIDRLAMTRLRD